jgi:hypothetical protein
VLSVCRAHGRAVRGRRPGQLIGDVPDEWVLEVGDDQLAEWEALPYIEKASVRKLLALVRARIAERALADVTPGLASVRVTV